MSRLSQYISFINAETVPSSGEMKTFYPNIDKTSKLIELRQEHQKRIKDETVIRLLQFSDNDILLISHLDDLVVDEIEQRIENQ